MNRYARQIQFESMGQEAQSRLTASDVAILGCGALGTVAAEILARAGVGRLRLIDRDVVEWTNLQRQALFDERDASEGRAKAAAAAERLRQINSEIRVDPDVTDITADNIATSLSGVDLVIDAADNFALRFLLNDWSLSRSTPWVHGGCVGATGQVRLFRGEGPFCFRCLVPEPPPAASVATCDTAGVIGSATHLIASLQATEAIKWLSGNRDAVRQSMLSVDLWKNRTRDIALDETLSPNCPTCVGKRYEFLEGGRGGGGAAALCGRDAVQIPGQPGAVVDLAAQASRWQSAGRVQSTPFFARLHLPDHTVTLFRDGRAVITGTDEVSRGRTLYDRYVGS